MAGATVVVLGEAAIPGARLSLPGTAAMTAAFDASSPATGSRSRDRLRGDPVVRQLIAAAYR
jgi:hypothetical protein